MSVTVAADGRIATYAHRCSGCSACWVSTHETERRCIFCGADSIASGPEHALRAEAVRTDAPKREPSRPRQHRVTKPEQRDGRKGVRKAGREVDVSPSQRAFRDRVDRFGRG